MSINIKAESTLQLTRFEAEQIILHLPVARKRFYTHANVSISVSTQVEFPLNREVRVGIKLTKTQAVQLVHDLISDVGERTGDRIKLRVCTYEGDRFVKGHTAIWIG